MEPIVGAGPRQGCTSLHRVASAAHCLLPTAYCPSRGLIYAGSRLPRSRGLRKEVLLCFSLFSRAPKGALLRCYLEPPTPPSAAALTGQGACHHGLASSPLLGMLTCPRGSCMKLWSSVVHDPSSATDVPRSNGSRYHTHLLLRYPANRRWTRYPDAHLTGAQATGITRPTPSRVIFMRSSHMHDPSSPEAAPARDRANRTLRAPDGRHIVLGACTH